LDTLNGATVTQNTLDNGMEYDMIGDSSYGDEEEIMNELYGEEIMNELYGEETEPAVPVSSTPLLDELYGEETEPEIPVSSTPLLD
jgi:hypothetical protein